MIEAAILIVGIVAGGALVYFPRREEVLYLRNQLAIAQDRTYHAWKEEYTIPPRPDEPKEIELDPLPREIQLAVDDWESQDSRIIAEVRARKLQSQGLGIPAILAELEKL